MVRNYRLKAKAFKTGTAAKRHDDRGLPDQQHRDAAGARRWQAHSLAIRSDGVVRRWGNNVFGELGIGASTADKVLPVAISVHNGGVVCVCLRPRGAIVLKLAS